MQHLIQILIYAIAGYTAAYMVLRPKALIDALLTGPGMGAAGWTFHREHYKLTYPVLAVLLVVLALAIAQIPGAPA
ncbi:hypothetical protein BDE40_0762 [Litoreibacter halocynthiae]|uniref:Uncharacterized protein n=1 Tax=Litoreibacter halocynthiae TaxID=1242689 RepID=A0A4V3EXB0_9RHOB|nr:hypothetical protein [Litoreibacter halocynthiae]TDT77475.1 hypothetical protein BDE40_0762 [Litoreibacter halocynthiae]